MERLKKYVDPLLLIDIVLLLVMGVFMVASSSWAAGMQDGNAGTYYLKRHLLYLALGIGAAFVGYILPVKFYRKVALPLWVVSILLCGLVAAGFGVTINGATRWLQVPGTGFRFMPSDLLKYTSIFYVAHLCVLHRKNHRKKGFLAIMCVIGVSVIVVAKEDFSSASVIGLSLFSTFFISGIRFHEFVAVLGAGALGFFLFAIRVPYRMKRLTSFLDPFDDIPNTDWQLANSLYALGMGSITGVGYFQSNQKFNNLPEAYNDFIFAIIGEELGLIGTFSVIALFAFFVYRGFQVAVVQEGLYEKLLASGIFVSIGFQAFFNMGVAAGILPVTGLTLPFISYGGTALILVMGMSGILLRLSGKGVSA